MEEFITFKMKMNGGTIRLLFKKPRRTGGHAFDGSSAQGGEGQDQQGILDLEKRSSIHGIQQNAVEEKFC